MMKTKSTSNPMLLVLSEAISDLGNWVSRIAALTLVMQIYGTALSTSMVSIVSLTPQIVLSPLAGRVADRYDKKKIIILSNILNAILVALIPLSHESMLILLFMMSAVSTFKDIASDSIVPFLVEESKLKELNSIYSSFSSAVMVFGPALSGILTSFFDIDTCFIIDSISYLLAAFLLVRLRYIYTKQEEPKQQEKYSFFKTIKYIQSVPKLLSVVATVAAVGLAGGMLNSLLIVYVYNYMGLDSAGYGTLMSCKGAAMLIAALGIYKLSDRISNDSLFCSSLLGLGISLMLFPLNTAFLPGLIIQALNGVCNAGYSIARVSLIQATADKTLIGQVFSVNAMLSNVLSVTSLGMFGFLADIIGVQTVLLIGGGIVLFAAIFSAVIFSRRQIS